MRLQLGVQPARPDDATTKEYVDALHTMVNREVPTGVIDGTNAVFTLAHTPEPGTEMVFMNGLVQQAGAGDDYTISGPTITFPVAPPLNTTLSVTYWYNA
jgi:hypothetical protein